MRQFLLTACLLSTLGLCACACPVPEQQYHKTPYDDGDGRTAGHGYVHDHCLQMSMPWY
jgi:hypothetical protein